MKRRGLNIFFLVSLALSTLMFGKAFDIRSREVVNLSNFTDYYEDSEITNGGVQILDSNFVTIEKEFDFSETPDETLVAQDTESEKPAEVVKEKPEIKEYTIRKGDSLYKIAKTLGVDYNILVANNPNVKNGKIIAGQKLQYPTVNGVYYTVRKGDSLSRISQRYGVKIAELLDANDLASSNLKVGQKLFVKNPSLDKISAITSNSNSNSNSRSSGKSTSNAFAFQWPVKWRGVTSPFGKRFHPVLKRTIYHQGVDLRAAVGAPLYAPESGKVTTAGWLGGYGKIIILKHKNGYETRMGHLDKIYVTPGQYVKKGDLIGKTGKTGRVTGPHLHFEIRKNGVPQNPMNYRR